MFITIFNIIIAIIINVITISIGHHGHYDVNNKSNNEKEKLLSFSS